MSSYKNIKWHKPQKGEVVRYWDEQVKIWMAGTVLRPAGAGNMVRILPQGWETGWVYAHVTNIEATELRLV